MKKFIFKLISYPLSVIHYFLFAVVLFLFHPIQWLALKFGGYSLHKKSVDYLNFFLTGTLFALGSYVKFNKNVHIPEGVPLIFVSNHQSTFDIPPMYWYMHKYHLKFVSKKELGKGIPSVSFNLRHGGSVLIDRKNARQSLAVLSDFGKYIEKTKYAAVIFPEGTRSKNGVPKPFRNHGLKILVKNSPSSFIVPISINNSWKIVRYGNFPLGIFNKITFDVHTPIKSNSMPFDELFDKIEKAVVDGVRVT